MSKTHQAAITSQKGEALTITNRPTPSPGPNELLIEVHALALNPVDHYQRDTGAFITEYPTILGSDVAGIIIETGSSTRSALKRGTRVVALASTFFTPGNDYGAFQERVLVKEDTVSVLPESYSFIEGACFPLAVITAWNGWIWAGLEPTSATSSGTSTGTSSTGTAKLMGFTIYATASQRHHEYILGLGAKRVFDYKDVNVLDQIVSAARDEGVTIRIGYHAIGDQQLAVDTLDALRGSDHAKVAIAPILDPGLKVPDSIESAFVYAPLDPDELRKRVRLIFVEWLESKLAAKEVAPSPYAKVVKGGLESVNGALDELKSGVSCMKVVVELRGK
ncbi:Dehydrogenase orsE [Penicillium citrinum]|uniref:Dehydrogenase orsE n=1 Tax=Penicillium citrinum TaxID=5077 RepID=A0A9W9PAU3_PENCI|nr:Dehydrogenase orsE [Penicillium citrinum]KAJ5241040.1 Dehydrogenase orsE [Penicillium citrinum]